MLHFFYSDDEKNGTQNVIKYLILVKLLLLGWPSGPRRKFKYLRMRGFESHSKQILYNTNLH